MKELKNCSKVNNRSPYYKKRIDATIAAASLDDQSALYIDSLIDIYYLTGLKLSLGRVVLSRNGSVIFVDPRYKTLALKESPLPVSDYTNESFSQVIEELKVQKVIVSRSLVSLDQYEKLSEINSFDVVPSNDHPSLECRLVKDCKELNIMRDCAHLIWEEVLALTKKMRAGITEKEATLELEYACRQKGASKMAFDPIIAFGEGSALPHYHPGDRKLQNGDVILIDAGVTIDEYNSDMTRVFFFGTPNPKIEELYHITRLAHQASLNICRAGTTVEALDLAARQVMREKGVEELFIHSLGHGIGLEVHEPPRISSAKSAPKMALKENMAITIEPGLYLPDVGGCRHEDTVIITKKGYDNLYPEEYNPHLGG